MKQSLRTLLALLTRYCDNLRGARKTRIISINTNPKEAYRIQTDNGGSIHLFCTETVFETTYRNWWVPSQRHSTYKVYGVCDASIPVEFAERVGLGLHIGSMLPRTASRTDQKKAAIHAHMSMIVSELRRSTATPEPSFKK